jgi:CheY-like chemotaxis protein
MSRILLVDDSPHAQRMGERILTDDGYEVVTVSNADSALIRLDDVDPDIVIADTVMPGGRTGYEICQFLRMSPRHRHVRVILTAGVLEPFDDAQLKGAAADGVLKKPFEATALLEAVQPLAEAAARIRAESQTLGGKAPEAARTRPAAPQPFVAVLDPEQVKAAVTIALDASMEAMVEEIAARVLETLTARKSEDRGAAVPAGAGAPPPFQGASLAPREAAASDSGGLAPAVARPLPAEDPLPAPENALLPPAPPAPFMTSSRPLPKPGLVRRVTPVRRSGSILGLEIAVPEPSPELPPPDSGARE